jgi:UDP-N-acetylglucosamine acyltransferase
MKEIFIHSTAVVHPEARFSPGVRIGPFTVVGPQVVLKEDVEVMSHCHLDGNTTVGERTRIFPGSVIGTPPQDRRYKNGDDVCLIIGKDNILREHVMINMGTRDGGGKTVIGDGNLLMAYSHVAHDCRVGSQCVFANVATLAGHVVIEDGVVIGGLSAVHQFVRIGKYAMIGGCSRVTQDVVPFALCSEPQTRVFGVNAVGLKRAGFSQKMIADIKRAFKFLFFSELSRPHALDLIKKEIEMTDELKYLLDFTQSSKRGLMTAK